jgi:hypothetical protein
MQSGLERVFPLVISTLGRFGLGKRMTLLAGMLGVDQQFMVVWAVELWCRRATELRLLLVLVLVLALVKRAIQPLSDGDSRQIKGKQGLVGSYGSINYLCS